MKLQIKESCGQAWVFLTCDATIRHSDSAHVIVILNSIRRPVVGMLDDSFAA